MGICIEWKKSDAIRETILPIVSKERVYKSDSDNDGKYSNFAKTQAPSTRLSEFVSNHLHLLAELVSNPYITHIYDEAELYPIVVKVLNDNYSEMTKVFGTIEKQLKQAGWTEDLYEKG